ncbi:hypothetical protein PLESTM_000151900 [Pleodorina starrii]|nr:hypothetical protein PLESTM_000151900 [Pleodorina starrii]
MSTIERPPEYGGQNVAETPGPHPAPAATCINDTAAAVLDRCYPLAGLYVDVGMYGTDVVGNGSLTAASGYMIRFVNFTFLCPSILSADCIAKLGPVGCVMFTLASAARSETRPPPSPGSGLAAATGGGGGSGAGGDGDHGARRRLAIILGSTLGGTVFLALLLAPLLVVRQTVRQQQRRKGRQHAATPCGSAPGRGAAPPDGEWGTSSAPARKKSDLKIGPAAAALSNGAGTGTDDSEPNASAAMYGMYDRSADNDDNNKPEGPSCGSKPLNGATRAPLTEDDATTVAAAAASAFDSIGPMTALGTAAAADVITKATPPRAGFRFGVQLVATRNGGGGGAAAAATAPQSDDVLASRPATGRCGAPLGSRSDGGAARGNVPQQLADGHAGGGSAGMTAGQAAGGGGGGGGGDVPSNVVTLTRRVLGKGATGRVYEGVYLGQAVAVKVVYSGGVLAPLPSAPPPPPPPEPSLPQQGLPEQPGAAAVQGYDITRPKLGQGQQQEQEQEQGYQHHQQQHYHYHHHHYHQHHHLQQHHNQHQHQHPHHQQQHHNQQQRGHHHHQQQHYQQHLHQHLHQHHQLHQQGGSDPPAPSVSVLVSPEDFGRGSAGAQSATLLESFHEHLTASAAAAVAAEEAAAEAAAEAELAAAGGLEDADSSSGGGSGSGSDSGSWKAVLCRSLGTACQPPPSPPPPLAAPPPPPQQQQGGSEGVTVWFLDTHDPRFEALFRQEAEVLGRCCHSNVVRLLAACVTPPRLCLVMELMETSLERLIYAGRTALLPLPTVLHIAAEVCQGLEYLHPTIIHRDLKPANVLVNDADSPTPVVKLSDFGLARIRSATMPTQHPGAGTPAYLAPECYDLENNVVTHHADMFALGVLLWAMLTGQQPWKNHSVVAIGYRVSVLKERLPLDQLSGRRCPPKLKALVRGCWEEDPRRRPAAAEAAKELQALRQQLVLHGGSYKRYNSSSGLAGSVRQRQPQTTEPRPRTCTDAAGGVDGPEQRVLALCGGGTAAAAGAPQNACNLAAAAAAGGAGSGESWGGPVKMAAADTAAALARSQGGRPMGHTGLQGAVARSGPAADVTPCVPGQATEAAAATAAGVAAGSAAAAWLPSAHRLERCLDPNADLDPGWDFGSDSGSVSEGALNRLMEGVTLEMEAH